MKLLLFIACWRKWYVHAIHFLLVTGGPLDVMEHLNTPPASEPSTKRVRSSWENDILVTKSERTQSNSAKLQARWPQHGRSQDFSVGVGGGGSGHTLSNRGYSPYCHVDLYAVFNLMWQKKAYERGGGGGGGPPTNYLTTKLLVEH